VGILRKNDGQKLAQVRGGEITPDGRLSTSGNGASIEDLGDPEDLIPEDLKPLQAIIEQIAVAKKGLAIVRGDAQRFINESRQERRVLEDQLRKLAPVAETVETVRKGQLTVMARIEAVEAAMKNTKTIDPARIAHLENELSLLTKAIERQGEDIGRYEGLPSLVEQAMSELSTLRDKHEIYGSRFSRIESTIEAIGAAMEKGKIDPAQIERRVQEAIAKQYGQKLAGQDARLEDLMRKLGAIESDGKARAQAEADLMRRMAELSEKYRPEEVEAMVKLYAERVLEGKVKEIYEAGRRAGAQDRMSDLQRYQARQMRILGTLVPMLRDPDFDDMFPELSKSGNDNGKANGKNGSGATYL